MKSLHLFSLLLSYPTQDLQAVCSEIRDRLSADKSLPPDTAKRLHPLLTRLAASDVYDAQEAYVELFDRGRAHSLHLFEHVHGESRDRGQAMVDLRQRYLDGGLEPQGNELPDYLPLFLDYCSTLPDPLAREQPRDEPHGRPAVAAVEGRLRHGQAVEPHSVDDRALVAELDPDAEIPEEVRGRAVVEAGAQALDGRASLG